MGTERQARVRATAGRLVIAAALLGVLAPAVSCSATPQPGAPEASPTISVIERDTLAVPVGKGPTGLALDDRGRLWTVNSGDGTVTRVNDKGAVDLTVPVGGRPQRAVWWADALWVTVRDDNYLVRVDGEGRAPTHQIAVGADPFDVLAAYGRLWVVASADGTLLQIDPANGNRIGAPLPVGRGARRMTAGGDAIWVSNPESDRILKVDPQTGVVTTFPASCRGPEGLIAREGLLWVACADSDETVALDELTGAIKRRVPVAGRPDTLGPAADGNLWVSVHAGPSVYLVSPHGRGQVQSRWPIGTTTSAPSPGTATPSASPTASLSGGAQAPVDLIPLGTRMWLTSYANGRVYGLDITTPSRG